MLMLRCYIFYAAPVAEVTGKVTGIGVADGEAEGDVPPLLPVFF